MRLTTCELILIDSFLDHGIQGGIRACSGAQRYVEEHRGVRWCVVMCKTALGGRRSGSHHSAFPYSVTDTSMQEGCRLVWGDVKTCSGV